MVKNSKFHIDLNKAKNFFKKKMEKNLKHDSDSEKQKFRNFDDETIKISKLSARIDLLKDSLRKKEIKTQKVKSESLKKKKIISKKQNIFIPSTKNKDINGKPIRNYIMDMLDEERAECVIMKDFEINQKLYLSGNINNIPINVINILINEKMIRSLNEKIACEIKSKKSYFVKKTFGISELKRSKLRNNKKFK